MSFLQCQHKPWHITSLTTELVLIERLRITFPAFQLIVVSFISTNPQKIAVNFIAKQN